MRGSSAVSIRPSRPKAKGRRAPTLDARRIDLVVGVIREWQGRLTWEALCAAVERKTGDLYTRQALNNHVPIRAAYEAYRARPAPSQAEKHLSATERRVRTLQAEVLELQKVRDALLEKFVRWAYNAALRGLDEIFLDRPLPQIDRTRNR